MTFVSGLFTLDLDFNDPRPTLAWAECDVDLMGQPIVRVHYVSADGFGKDSYGWFDNLFLRVDCVARRLDLVLDSEGEWGIQYSFEIGDIDDDLIDAKLGEAEPEYLLSLLLDAASSRIGVRSATDDDISRVERVLFIDERGIREELSRRGRWHPPEDAQLDR